MGLGLRALQKFRGYLSNSWQVKTTDGWTYIFPYRPHALPQNVTVLTGFVDPREASTRWSAILPALSIP
jgi:hypothetical protein